MTTYGFLNAGTTQAQNQLGLSTLFGPPNSMLASSGVLSGLTVAQTATASGSVLVGTGFAVVQASVTGGASLLVNDSTATVPVFTANPMGSLPRYDILVFNSVTSNLEVVVGTPNATPANPTVAATSLALARFRNAANATTIPASAIDDYRVWTGLEGATVIVNGTGQRNSIGKYVGLRVYRTDLLRDETWDGTGWRTRISGMSTGVTTISSGDWNFDTGLSSIIGFIAYNANGGGAAANRQNITIAKNQGYSGGIVTGRVYSAENHLPVANQLVYLDWMAEGYAA